MAKSKIANRRENMFSAQGGICPYCDLPMESPNTSTLDHIIPKRLGGWNGAKNQVLVHRRCNGLKGGFGSYDEAQEYCRELMDLFARGMAKGLIPKFLEKKGLEIAVPIGKKIRADYEKEVGTALTF